MEASCRRSFKYFRDDYEIEHHEADLKENERFSMSPAVTPTSRELAKMISFTLSNSHSAEKVQKTTPP